MYFTQLSKAGLIITGGDGADTSIETFPAEANFSIPPFPSPGNRSSFFLYKCWILIKKEDTATPYLLSKMGLRWSPVVGIGLKAGLPASPGNSPKLDGKTTQT